ncbi:type II toxin-antitoxin system HicB family antitoxin [Mycobacteroides abscessus]|nr:type II toxin-antitoxin system HicB family antitoxin [Mycobacteroides abscessus]RIS08461.1 type II toxin-antitoxin system HicB family antitoxin [Mycobacteroides abscessus]
MDNHYTYRVVWSPEDEEFVGLVAEFPSLSWLDKDRGEAFAGIVRLVDDVLADMEETEETPPTPLSDRSYSGKFLVRSSPALHQRLTTEAAEQGVSLNQWVVQKLSAEQRSAPPSAPIGLQNNLSPFEAALTTEVYDFAANHMQTSCDGWRQKLSQAVDAIYGHAVPRGVRFVPPIYGTTDAGHWGSFTSAYRVMHSRVDAHADDESSFHPH